MSLGRAVEAQEVFGSEDDTHPGIKYLFDQTKEYYVGGALQALNRLAHYDFLELRCKCQALSLNETREIRKEENG